MSEKDEKSIKISFYSYSIPRLTAVLMYFIGAILASFLLDIEEPFRKNIIYVGIPLPIFLFIGIPLILLGLIILIYTILTTYKVSLQFNKNLTVSEKFLFLEAKRTFNRDKLTYIEVGNTKRSVFIWLIFSFTFFIVFYLIEWAFRDCETYFFGITQYSNLYNIYINLGLTILMIIIIISLAAVILLVFLRKAIIFDGEEVKKLKIKLGRIKHERRVTELLIPKISSYDDKEAIFYIPVLDISVSLFMLIFSLVLLLSPNVAFGDYAIPLSFLIFIFSFKWLINTLEHKLGYHFAKFSNEEGLVIRRSVKKRRISRAIYLRGAKFSGFTSGLRKISPLEFLLHFLIILELVWAYSPYIYFWNEIGAEKYGYLAVFILVLFILLLYLFTIDTYAEVISKNQNRLLHIFYPSTRVQKISLREFKKLMSSKKTRSDIVIRSTFVVISFAFATAWVLLSLYGVTSTLFELL